MDVPHPRLPPASALGADGVPTGEAPLGRDDDLVPPPVDSGPRGPGAGPLVLVVDDAPINRRVAVRMLEKSGYQPRTAGNGRLAIEALAKESCDLVLMDCQMPVLDGYDATREIRRLEQGGQRRVSIVAMTAHAMPGERERCLAAGMDDYLTKPLRQQLLRDALGRWIPTEAGGRSARAGAPAAAAAGAAGAAGPELLDEVVITDLESLGDGLLTDLLPVYFDGAAAVMAELADAAGRGETLTIARAAHKLKGSSVTVGATRVASLAAELETEATAGEAPAADALDALRAGLADTRTAFARRGGAAAAAGRDGCPEAG